jgi:hypothetical protein
VSKNYQKLWKEELKDLARSPIPRPTTVPKNAFQYVVDFVQMGEEDDKPLIETFSLAKLNLEDPFHWWELLHRLIMIHTDRTTRRSTIWTEAKLKKLERDCVKIGRVEHTKTIKHICSRVKEICGYKETAGNLALQISRYKLTARIKKKIV